MEKSAGAKTARPDLSYARVLVVDDFQTNLDMAELMLRKFNLQVDCVNNGREAVDRIARGEPVYNIILMDHLMPGMDGMEAVRLIRALNTEYAQSLPVIAVTANETEEHTQVFLDNGFSAFLSKPLSMAKLDDILVQWLLSTKH